ncbi:hypothetical protein ASPWEDRAFT_104267 [Aspergillus wentii DTO 134E9]|uniref:Uncharacterized protein n=1 Tax=Aspergillus wentii DTO 134E9 TaxID=1073089 RepID=A0A1L9RTD9_ASPWE|nr:uncharacterized protein ASPWEDRAFT_104267 [Aspergillus wentii DTO 134E9]KAI9933773.1 hypothetical protein MW887_004845 [Aspergillus wentii]OJJ38118.1 hypothetical protein ASPWEDRAFT_104267 [Aspergillus wentii DTO 134E9]
MRSESPEEPRKRTRVIAPTRQCHDWMVVSGNCHYARDETSFTTYRPVSRSIRNNIFNPHDELHVAGVGTVALHVCPSPTQFGSHTIILENVLHIPDAVCNGFNPLLVGSSMSCEAEMWSGADAGGNAMWYSRPFAGGTRLVLAGNPQGESELIEGKEYSLSLYISPEEKEELFSGANGVDGVDGMDM